MNNKISILSRIALVISAAFLSISIFVPIWQIQLDAPQYPEGLGLKIMANGLGGDVEIINGLNHYIGMKTLHAKDFVEFSILGYIIGFYALFALIVAIAGRKKLLYSLFTLFVLFGVVAMADFWRWEFNYGHDLNPNAAIIVPGMAYQPPLIGFKQLLNFGAYSIPDTGGWLFVGSGVLMLIAVLIEKNVFSKKHKKQVQPAAALITLTLLLSSCASNGPEPINLNKDNCDNCKMSISEIQFACELLTSKGRVYKFDDVSCMLQFKKENPDKAERASFYVSNFISLNELIPAEKITFVTAEAIKGPMGGNAAAFGVKDSAVAYANKVEGQITDWQAMNK
ncbi:MAG: nitrous oxide reductase accessory protein NosL [Bacteroidia bacterium]